MVEGRWSKAVQRQSDPCPPARSSSARRVLPRVRDPRPSEREHHARPEHRPVEAAAAALDAGVGDVLIRPADKRANVLMDLERCAEAEPGAEVEMTLSGEVRRRLLQSQ